MHIFFWQNILSFHQSAHIRALADMPEHKVTLVAQEGLPKIFTNSGWMIPDFGNTRIIIPSSDRDIKNLILNAEHDIVHIFSGIRFPMVRKAFLSVIKTKSYIGLLAESPDWRGIKGLVRYLFYKYDLSYFNRKIDFILAIGQLAVQWYLKCGFPATKIFSYGYFVEKPNRTNIQPNANNDTYRLIFVGRCVKLKGIDILLTALNGLNNMKWHLDIIGDGPELNNLKKYSINLKLNNVKFHGAKSNKETLEAIAKADLLMLPSKKDGWGAVVNEALMQGVPVVCSNACGAADLLNDPERGDTFEADSVSQLRTKITNRINLGKTSPDVKKKIIEWSINIEGDTAARYLIDVINAVKGIGQRPTAPWL